MFFFYSVDDTRLKNPQTARRFTMPTALERAGDFSQTRTSSGALIVVRDPLTGQHFPGQRDSRRSGRPARPGDAEPAADAEHDRCRLQLRGPGSQHSGPRGASTSCGSTTAPRTTTASRSRGRPGSPTASGSTSPAPRRGGASSASATTSRLTRSRRTTPASSARTPSSKRASASSTAPSSGRPKTTRALAGIQRSSYPALADAAAVRGGAQPAQPDSEGPLRHPPEQQRDGPAGHRLRQPLADHRRRHRARRLTADSRTRAATTRSRPASCASTSASPRPAPASSAASSTSRTTAPIRSTPASPSPTPTSGT